MSGPVQIALRVREVEPLGPTLKRFVFEAADGGLLPTSAAGAHIVLTLDGEGRSWRNSYSVVSPPGERRGYEVIVRRVAESRGGSAFLHERVGAGDIMHAAPPHNLFPLQTTARRHVLIGGGIGVTPLLAHMAALRARGARFELHQVCSAAEAPLFERLLAPLGGSDAHVHAGRDALDLTSVLARQPLGTDVYVCGPAALMEAVTGAAGHLGWPANAVHHESFGDHSSGAPFVAVLAKSQLEIEVGPNQSLLEAVEAAGVEAPYLCRGGACGQCMTGVIDGQPDHRDDVLSAEERAGGEVMMICVSRARTPRLVLDL